MIPDIVITSLLWALADVQKAADHIKAQEALKTPPKAELATSSPKELIARLGGKHAPIMERVAYCESGLRHEGVYGDNSLAYGTFQYHRGTFEWFNKRATTTPLNYYDLYDQVWLTAWAFDNGLESHWTCWKLLQTPPKGG